MIQLGVHTVAFLLSTGIVVTTIWSATSPYGMAGPLAGHPLAFNDGNGPAGGAWTGVSTFADTVGGTVHGIFLSGTVEWAVFPPGVFPYPGVTDWSPLPGQLTYAYQIYHTGPAAVDFMRVNTSIALGSNGGAFDLGNGADIPPSTVAFQGFGSLLHFRFDTIKIPPMGSSAGLAFSSDRIPLIGTGTGIVSAPSLNAVDDPRVDVLIASLTVYQPPNEDADFDNDGDVDGRDFLKWQRGETNPPLSSHALALWQSQYGMSIAAASVSVPEPSSILLSLIALSSVVRNWRPECENYRQLAGY
jgi:hypothetical protein